MDFLHNDKTLKVAGLIVAAATAVSAFTPSYTVAGKASHWIIGLSIALGLNAVTGREQK